MPPQDAIPPDDVIPPPEEPLIDDPKPPSLRLRVTLIVLAVGMFFGGIVLHFRYIRALKQHWREKSDASLAARSPRHAPPPAEAYPWVKQYDPANSIAARIPPPPGTVRVAVPPDSFAHWLRYLPLRTGQQQVLLHDGRAKQNQLAHWAVLDIDTGSSDLQQSAQAVWRLRAEYLYARHQYGTIRLPLTGSGWLEWDRWRAGERPTFGPTALTWGKGAATADDGYPNFRAYLNVFFAHTDTTALARELLPVPNVKEMQIGDVFVHPAVPGHAVIVVDMVENPRGQEKGFLLAQSFFPAQDMHILLNAYDPAALPWYRSDFGETLQTPEWSFPVSELRRFR